MKCSHVYRKKADLCPIVFGISNWVVGASVFNVSHEQRDIKGVGLIKTPKVGREFPSLKDETDTYFFAKF